MSSTRRSSSGEFRQERFCSAPEFEGDAINGLLAVKRIGIVKDRSVREVLWFIQWRSLTSGGLQQLCDDLLAGFPERIGTPALRKLKKSAGGDRILKEQEITALREEFPYHPEIFSIRELLGPRDDEEVGVNGDLSQPHFLSEFSDQVKEQIDGLRETLVRFCLDPQENIERGVWYFEDLLGALTTLRERFMTAARDRLADTAASREINKTLDFWYARRRMVLIEGVAGIGRTATTRAWCDAHGGMVRYVEVPSSSDDRSFFASIARQLGVACGVSFKAQQIKVRIEEVLANSDLGLALDESQYLWGQAMRPRKTPDRLLWLKSIFDAGTPIALIAHTDFSKWQRLFVDRTLWTDEQFERRINRRPSLPTEHSKEDMLKIARSHFPSGDSKSWKLLSGYALGTKKKQASGIVEALESARYRAHLAGRDEATFDDVEAALIHDHGFICSAPAEALQPASAAVALPLRRGRSAKVAADPRTDGEADFPIRVRSRITRIHAPAAT